jgi:hypothetical protein
MERSLAEAARNEAARRAHEEMARAYEQEIERKSGGQIAFPWDRGGDADPGSDQLINARPTPSASS